MSNKKQGVRRGYNGLVKGGIDCVATPTQALKFSLYRFCPLTDKSDLQTAARPSSWNALYGNTLNTENNGTCEKYKD